MEPIIKSDNLCLRSLRIVLLSIIIFSLGTGNTYPVVASYIKTRIDRMTDADPDAFSDLSQNTPPVADAGGPYAGRILTDIAFDGSGSSDADGDGLTYFWDFGDGDTGTGVAPSHSYSQPGAYTVTLTVNDGLEDSEPASAKVVISVRTVEVDLDQGWNLISLPVEPVVETLPDVLESIEGVYSSVWAYDADTETWSAYYPDSGIPGLADSIITSLGVGSLTKMVSGKGYWLNMIQAGTLAIKMRDVADDPIPLKERWNLVGFNSMIPQMREDALAEIDYDSIWEYDSSAGDWLIYAQGWLCPDAMALNELIQLSSWKGYWIYSLYDTMWDVAVHNDKPVADAGGPYKVDLGSGIVLSGITLDGSASWDPNTGAGDGIVSYRWDVNGDGIFGDVTGVNPALSIGDLASFGISSAGVFPVVLEVQDARGADDIDMGVIQVLENAPVAVAKADPATAGVGEPVTFDHSDSWHNSVGHSIALYEWDFDSDGTYDFSTNDASEKPQHQYPFISGMPSRTETAVLRVTDDNSPPRTDTDTVEIDVIFTNSAPVAEANGPYPMDLGDGVTLDGSGSSDPDTAANDSIVSYEWDINYDGSEFVTDVTGVNPTLTAGELVDYGIGTEGEYVIALRVTDTFGATGEDTGTINVFPNVPVAVAKAAPDTVGTGEPVTFDHSDSWHNSISHAIVLYEWDFDSDGTFDYTTSDASDSPQHSFPIVPGSPTRTETALLRVTDNNVPPLSATDAVDITVVLVNNAPVADANGPYEMDLGDGISLDGSGSSDPDTLSGDSIVSYEWDVNYNGVFVTDVTGVNPALTAGELDSYGISAAGDYPVALRVTDSFGAADEDATTIKVYPTNNPPVADANGPYNIQRGQGVTLDGSGSYDQDTGDSIVSYQWDMNNDGTYGDVSGANPSLTALELASFGIRASGDYTISLQVKDTFDAPDLDSATLTVSNTPPVADAGVNQLVTAGSMVNLDGRGSSDPNGDPLSYQWSFVSVPPGSGAVLFGSSTATPGFTADLEGEYVVQLIVSDGEEYSGPDTVTVTAGEDYLRPVVDVTVTPSVASPGASVTITVDAQDNVGVVSRSLTVNGVNVPLDSSGQAAYSSPAAGVFTAVGTAIDVAGLEGQDSEEFRFIGASDGAAPAVDITSPADNSKISEPTDIIGTASDANLTRYTLSYSAKDKNEFVTFASGTSSVTNAFLGRLDPTKLKNGLYDIRLTAEDAGGNTSAITRVYQLEGEMKVGNFTLSYIDLNIPMAGIPITITRTYDSRVKAKGDFGVGWTLNMKDIQLSENRVPGDGWSLVCTKMQFGFCIEWGIVPATDHSVVVSMGEALDHEFDVQANTTYADQFGIAQGYLSFPAKPGTFSTLEALGNTTYDFIFGSELTDGSFNVLNPNRYRFTTREGNVYIINQPGGLESITDANGNKITFGPGGITHSAGRSVVFTRDAEGRITAITDPKGNTIQYEYDFYGDLISVIDQEGNKTQFTYNSDHGLVDIIDPRGIRPIRNEYDDQGRIIAHIDAYGNRIEYTHNVGARQEIMQDRLGNITVYEYDDKGNIIQKTDPLGNVTSYTYDARGNKLTETNPLGQTTTYAYNTSDQITSITDPLGNVISYTYNSKNQMLTRTDPLGHVITLTYDANGNMLTQTDHLGNVTTCTYDAQGNKLTETDPLGNTHSYAYDANGNEIQVTDPLGNVTIKTYDANGNLLTKSTTRTVNGVVKPTTWTYAYDALNRLIQTTDPEGNITQLTYTITGNKASETDGRGNTTTFTYDELNRLIRTDYPDGTNETTEYDAENREIAKTDRTGRRTEFTYDKLGSLVSTLFPDGSTTHNAYDAAGRKISETDENGNTVTFAYDAASRNTSIQNALGGIASFAYDATGKIVSRTDRNGHTTTFVYDEINRLVRTNFPDGTFTTTTYDANRKKLSETDQAGNTTTFQYDACGRLIRVVDAMGNITLFSYDEVGNRISQTDPLGNITKFTYDGNGRLLTKKLPLGQTESRTYDAAGNLATVQDFSGKTITNSYDTMNRLTQRALPGGGTYFYTYTPTGKMNSLTDSRGITQFTYDLRDRLTQIQNPDASFLQYTHDAKGNRTSVTAPGGTTTYEYNADNRLLALNDPDSRQTTFSYDAAGNRAGIAYPNGVNIAYTYDSLNRLTGITQTKGATTTRSYSYTLGPAGNRTRVTEDTGRTVDYTYDNTFRLTQELINDPSTGISTFSYTYDAAGNRVSMTAPSGTTAYAYDANNRLTTAGTATLTYDNNGNTLTRTDASGTATYQYDGLNRLIQATSPTGDVTGYVYDGLNNRVRKTDSLGTTNYLVDPFSLSGLPQVLRETDGTGTALADYVYGMDLVSMERASGVSFFLHDGQMSTRLLTDATGAVTDSYDYDAFGNLLAQTGTTPNNYLYNSQQLDPNIGFYYLRARYYDPDIGRFISLDPSPGNIFDPPSLHPYIYANNDPVNRSDPTGEYTLAEAAIASSIIGLVAAIGTYIYTGSLKKALIVGLIVSVGAFLILAPFAAPAIAAEAGMAAEVDALIKLSIDLLMKGNINGLVTLFTQIAASPGGKALLLAAHQAISAIIVLYGAKMTPQMVNYLLTLQCYTGIFAGGGGFTRPIIPPR